MAGRIALLVPIAAVVACARLPPPVAPNPVHIDLPTQIVAPLVDGTPRELLRHGEEALAAGRYGEAADCFNAILAGAAPNGSGPDGDLAPQATFDLALSYEGLGQRENARDRYHEVASLWPEGTRARTSLLSAMRLHVFLGEWARLEESADIFLGRADLDQVDRLTGLGARGLSRIERGDDAGATRDVQEGLDLVEELRYGMTGKLPPPVAQLRFALAEVRRVRSERIRLAPQGEVVNVVPADFPLRMDARCRGLLEAQSAYADAMRSTDLHWAAMAGTRVGEMYRDLHRDLMAIPPTTLAKSPQSKQIFYAFMHVRYRVLLEKGLDMLQHTLVLGERGLDDSAWMGHARAVELEVESALAEERAILKTFPFSEDEMEKAIEIMKANAAKVGRKR